MRHTQKLRGLECKHCDQKIKLVQLLLKNWQLNTGPKGLKFDDTDEDLPPSYIKDEDIRGPRGETLAQMREDLKKMGMKMGDKEILDFARKVR